MFSTTLKAPCAQRTPTRSLRAGKGCDNGQASMVRVRSGTWRSIRQQMSTRIIQDSATSQSRTRIIQ